jgi:mono/diheme cytochrome c family protein
MPASNRAGPIALGLMLGLGQAGCNPRTPAQDDAAPAPMDTAVQTGTVATSTAPSAPVDTPPTPSGRDPQPAAPSNKPDGAGSQGAGLTVSRVEYEGWRQYSVNCARCHGQDVLPNPVAANLLVSLGSGGAIDSPEKFGAVVSQGRKDRGMPAFGGQLTPEQINAIYAYVNGRAEKRISAGRPGKPEA